MSLQISQFRNSKRHQLIVPIGNEPIAGRFSGVWKWLVKHRHNFHWVQTSTPVTWPIKLSSSVSDEFRRTPHHPHHFFLKSRDHGLFSFQGGCRASKAARDRVGEWHLHGLHVHRDFCLSRAHLIAESISRRWRQDEPAEVKRRQASTESRKGDTEGAQGRRIRRRGSDAHLLVRGGNFHLSASMLTHQSPKTTAKCCKT